MACTAYASGPVARAESGPSWLKSAARLRVKLQPKARQSHLLRYRDGRGDDWADIIDMLTMHPEAGRQVVRLLGEFEAADNVKRAGQAGKRKGSCPPFGARNAKARPRIQTTATFAVD